MTRENVIKAFTMKLDGYTYQAIAEEFGCSKQAIQDRLSRTVKSAGCAQVDKAVFPRLAKEIHAKYKDQKAFCAIVNISYDHFRGVMRGKIQPSYEDIMICCEHFGEDCLVLFRRREEQDNA